MYWLNEDCKSRIRNLAGETPEEESCGFIVAEDGGPVHAIKVQNHAEDKKFGFEISPSDFGKYNDQIRGIWHSHLHLKAFSPLDQMVMTQDVLPWAVYCLMDDSFIECDPTPGKIAPFEGRPFVFGIYDCYSLISDVLHHYGVQMPEWKRGKWGEWNTPDFAPFDLEWRNIGKPVTNGMYKPGDILLMNLGDFPGHTDHVGVFIDKKIFLHHPVDHLSRKQTYGGYWKDRVRLIIRPFNLG